MVLFTLFYSGSPLVSSLTVHCARHCAEPGNQSSLVSALTGFPLRAEAPLIHLLALGCLRSELEREGGHI